MRTTHAWIAALALLITFLVLDAGAIAWSAAFISGHQLTAALLTFFVVLSGAAITITSIRT
jgi:hypothetical protein